MMNDEILHETQQHAQKHDFLLEIGTEELPPHALQRLSLALGENIGEQFKSAELAYEGMKLFVTPRRLAVLVEALIDKQPDKEVTYRGPSVTVAFHNDGKPTAACIGFAKSCGVSVEDLAQITDVRGTWVGVKKVKQGAETKHLLPDLVSKALKDLPMPRQMRWGTSEISFIRPVHWVLMLFGTEVVTGTILGVTASNKTYGHRFHCPTEIVVDEPRHYEELLYKQGKVIADVQKRRAIIASQVATVTSSYGVALVEDALLEEVASITEWPVALHGVFDEHFLHLPREVLILVLQKQQRCFPVVDEHGSLRAHFVAISNIESKQPECVTKGNENVILARLTDADFFYRIDLQYLLGSYSDKLQATVFQAGLGSVYAKTERLKDAAMHIASVLNADAATVRRAAELCKSDLMTTMVGEFPELQGIMGYYYAVHEGEREEVALAIREHYLPSFAKDALPQTLAGAVLAIADRIDTIVGVFSLGKTPTGDSDPLGLRRAAFGVLRIILEKKLDIDVCDLVRRSLRKYLEQIDKFDELLIKNYEQASTEQENTLEDVAAIMTDKIMEFIFERLRSWYTERGVESNLFDAVKMRKKAVTRPLDFEQRLRAVQYFKTLAEAPTLSAAYKRVKNILASATEKKKVKGEGGDHVELNQKLLKETAEKALAEQLAKTSRVVADLLVGAQYKEALKEMAMLKASVDAFFDTVMVMVDDEKLRHNRLTLLQQLQDLFCSVADISYVGST